MALTVSETLQRCVAAIFLTGVVAACSTAPGQTQALSSEGHIRGSADTASLPSDVPPQDTPIPIHGGQGN